VNIDQGFCPKKAFPVNWRVLKLGEVQTPKSYSDHAVTSKQLVRLGITGDRGVPYIDPVTASLTGPSRLSDSNREMRVPAQLG